MGEWEQAIRQWVWVVGWAVGGLMLLVRYRSHPRPSRRGLAAAAVQLGLVLPLVIWWQSLAWGGRESRRWTLANITAMQWMYGGLSTLSYLLLAWAAVTDRPPTNSEE